MTRTNTQPTKTNISREIKRASGAGADAGKVGVDKGAPGAVSARAVVAATASKGASTATLEALAEVGNAVAKVVLRDVPLDCIEPNPYQPRRHFSPEELEDLANSIREHEVIQPIIVREIVTPDGTERYQLIAGERRWRASMLAGKATIPSLVRVLDEATMLELAIIENEQRVDVNPMDSARSYARLVELGRKQSEIGARIGKSQPLVANALRLLDLPPDVQQMIQSGALSRSHGTTLCRYAKYPAFVSLYARDIVKGNTRSKDIEKGIYIKDWEVSQKARSDGLMVMCYGVGFDLKQAQKAHPDAFFPTSNDGVACLNVPLFRRLEAEDKQRRDQEAAERAREVREGLKPGALPRLADLKYGTYEELHKGWNKCDLCTKECPCRSQAKNGENTVEICLDPARLKSLKAQETREKKKVLRVKVAEQSNLVTIESAKIEERLIVVGVYRTIREVGKKTVGAVASSLKLDFNAEKFFGHDTMHEFGSTAKRWRKFGLELS